jgi:hypothetical protein
VVERTKLAGSILRIVTEKSGPDDNKKSQFRLTYLIRANSFSIRKEVRFDGTAEFFERKQYAWQGLRNESSGNRGGSISKKMEDLGAWHGVTVSREGYKG